MPPVQRQWHAPTDNAQSVVCVCNDNWVTLLGSANGYAVKIPRPGQSMYHGGPMRYSVILGHPRPGSFNHAIAQVVCENLRCSGHEVAFHDLQAEGFDPVTPAAELSRDAKLPPDIARHCDEISSADRIVIVHPNWWGQPPAILKGWLDRVLRMGTAYKFVTNEKGEGAAVGLLKAKWAVVFTTSNTPQSADRELFGDPLENFWKRCVLEFCGVKQVMRVNYDVIITSTPQQREAWLEDARQRIAAAECRMQKPE